MATDERKQAAFRQADAILALEYMIRPPEMDALQEAVIDGRMSFDLAVRVTVQEERLRSGGRR